MLTQLPTPSEASRGQAIPLGLWRCPAPPLAPSEGLTSLWLFSSLQSLNLLSVLGGRTSLPRAAVSWEKGCWTIVNLSGEGNGTPLQYFCLENPTDGRLQFMGSLESDTTERLHFHFSLACIGEGNGNPLQCSCLENPRDRGAWWAAIYGVTQSWT